MVSMRYGSTNSIFLAPSEGVGWADGSMFKEVHMFALEMSGRKKRLGNIVRCASRGVYFLTVKNPKPQKSIPL